MKHITIKNIRPVEHVTLTNYKRNGYKGRAKELEVLDLKDGGQYYIVRHMNYEYADEHYNSITREEIIESRLYNNMEEAQKNIESKKNLVGGYKEYEWTF